MSKDKGKKMKKYLVGSGRSASANDQEEEQAKKMKTKIMLCLFCVIIFASFSAKAGSWTSAAKVTTVYAGYTDGAVYVSGLENRAGCNSSLIKFTTELSNPSMILSLALSAYLSGKKLICVVETDQCAGNYQVGRQCRILD